GSEVIQRPTGDGTTLLCGGAARQIDQIEPLRGGKIVSVVPTAARPGGQPIMTQPLLPLFEEDRRVDRGTAGTSFPIAARGRFIKQFTGPDADSGVVCFKFWFWQLVHASGCPYDWRRL